jgi:hypothetical protein
VAFSQQDQVRLSDLEVTSASTRMVHSEAMTPVAGGPIRRGESSLGHQQIENQSELLLRSVAVIRRVGDSHELQGCWIGDLQPKTSSAISKLAITASDLAEQRAEERKLLSTNALNLEPLFKVACDPRHLAPGEMRLVARVDEILPGSSVTPAASQAQGATLVVVHLDYGDLPAPALDDNSPLDVVTQ